GAELQRALDAASAGDTILLATGVTFTPPANDGSFVLRNRPLARGQWIVVRSANGALDAGGQLSPHTPAGAEHPALLAAIRPATVNAPAIRAESGASGYRLIGLDIGIAASVRQVTNLVELGVGAEPSIDAQPTDIIVDRSYLHGNDEGNFRRGVLMNGVRI